MKSRDLSYDDAVLLKEGADRAYIQLLEYANQLNQPAWGVDDQPDTAAAEDQHRWTMDSAANQLALGVLAEFRRSLKNFIEGEDPETLPLGDLVLAFENKTLVLRYAEGAARPGYQLLLLLFRLNTDRKPIALLCDRLLN